MSTGDIAGFITARLDERQKALEDLAKRRAAAAIPAIEMQQHAAIQCSVYADHPDYRPDWSL